VLETVGVEGLGGVVGEEGLRAGGGGGLGSEEGLRCIGVEGSASFSVCERSDQCMWSALPPSH
jgi:hypothetical protein